MCEGMARQKSVVQFLSVPVKSSLAKSKRKGYVRVVPQLVLDRAREVCAVFPACARGR